MQPCALAAWLRDRLRERNLSQRQLAAQTGIATGTISTTLHGHIPRPSLFVILAPFFGESAGTVLELAGLLELADLPAELPAEIRNMLHRLYRLPRRKLLATWLLVAQYGSDTRADQFNRTHEFCMRQGPRVHLEADP